MYVEFLPSGWVLKNRGTEGTHPCTVGSEYIRVHVKNMLCNIALLEMARYILLVGVIYDAGIAIDCD